MNKRSRASCLAASGLAISSAAYAQPFMMVSNQPGTWTEIRTTGTLVSTQGNNYLDAFTSSVTNALVTSASLVTTTDGFITDTGMFDMGPVSAAINQPLPRGSCGCGQFPAPVNFALFPFWDDIVGPFPFSSTGGVWHKHVVEGGVNVEVVEWYQVHENGFAGPLGSVEVKIFETGPIFAQFLYNYTDPAWCGSGAGQGPSNAGGTIGVQWPTGFYQHSYNTAGISPGAVLSIMTNPASGACCLIDGSCYLDTGAAGCQGRGGVFHGVGTTCGGGTCPQPPTGACCTDSGCVILNQYTCAAQARTGAQGEYHGDNSVCAGAGCGVNLIVNGGFERTFAPEWLILSDGSAYPQQTFVQSGTSAMAINSYDTSTTVEQQITGPHQGDPLTVSFWYRADGSSNTVNVIFGGGSEGVWQTLLNLTNDTAHTSWTHFSFSLASPCDNPIFYVDVSNFEASDYLDGVVVSAVPAAPPCYPNCDASTASPVLNVADFSCFLTKYASGDPYANCDASTAPPTLNVADFSCFLTKYASGCR
jgi:hypothetical protein